MARAPGCAGGARRWPGTRADGVDIDAGGGRRGARRVPGTRPWSRATASAFAGGSTAWSATRRGAPVAPATCGAGAESASAFVDARAGDPRPGGRLCLLVPAAWLEVAAHARGAAAAAARARRSSGWSRWATSFPACSRRRRCWSRGASRTRAARRATDGRDAGAAVCAQAELMRDPACALNARLTPAERALARPARRAIASGWRGARASSSASSPATIARRCGDEGEPIRDRPRRGAVPHRDAAAGG